MITVHIERKEFWDERTNQFVYVGPEVPIDLKMEHSLYSVSKWEAKYHKSYMYTQKKTLEETLDYMAMMVVNYDDVDPSIFKSLSKEEIERISNYINDPMTATTISEDKKGGKKSVVKDRIVTAELVYYWMSALNIPFECDRTWHFNRLITLIKVCSIESNPDKNKKKKMTSTDMANRKARMEAARAKYKKS